MRDEADAGREEIRIVARAMDRFGEVGRELAADGITVNNVLPGYTRTQRLDQILADRSAASGKPQDEIAKGMLASVPVGRFADAGEIGGVIAFLCTQAAAYVNGQSLAVDGGRTFH